MASNSYFSNELGNLVTSSGANPIYAGPLNPFDHQPDAYNPSSAFQADKSAITLPSSNPPAVAPVTNPIGWAAKENWARYRALIRRLYLCEKKPLKEVMRLMESEYGFKATVKMYKTHIKQWGLDKKNKESEMRAIVRKNTQRADQGKRSVIRVRDQHRDFAEIVRYWDRKGVSIDDIIARQTASPTPEAVQLSTPVPSPITTPQVLAIPEYMFRCIRNYFKSSFESGTWVTADPHFHCYSAKNGKSSSVLMAELCCHCDLACQLFSRNFNHEAGQSLIVATAHIKQILLDEDPLSLLGLWVLIVSFRRKKRDEMALIILQQFSAMGKVLLGNEHPLSRIYEWSTLVHRSNMDEIIIRCMESVVDSFENSVGPMHLSTIYARISLITRSIHGRDIHIQELQKLQKLLGECEHTLQPYDIRTCLIRRYAAIEYYYESNYSQAKALSQRNIAYFQDASLTTADYLGEDDDLFVLALCQYALGEVNLGLATLQQAIDSVMRKYGPKDPQVRYHLLILEDWYSEQGFWDSAAQVREQRVKILESIKVD